MSFSGDDFTVKDAVSGKVMFQIDGSAFSFRGEKSECCVMDGKVCFWLIFLDGLLVTSNPRCPWQAIIPDPEKDARSPLNLYRYRHLIRTTSFPS